MIVCIYVCVCGVLVRMSQVSFMPAFLPVYRIISGMTLRELPTFLVALFHKRKDHFLRGFALAQFRDHAVLVYEG